MTLPAINRWGFFLKKKLEQAKEITNQGKLRIDATCAPADVRYPTDLKLLNQGQIQTEKIIDVLYKSVAGKLKKKPRTYRKIARAYYLGLAE